MTDLKVEYMSFDFQCRAMWRLYIWILDTGGLNSSGGSVSRRETYGNFYFHFFTYKMGMIIFSTLQVVIMRIEWVIMCHMLRTVLGA